MKLGVRDLVLIALLAAVLLAVQVGLAALPNIELVSLLIIVFTLVFGYRVFIVIYVFVLLEGLIFGFGLWWLNYLYVWAVLAVVALLLRRIESPYLWVMISAVYGLMFGALCTIPYFFIGGTEMAFAYWVSGLGFDLLHCGGNLIVALLLFRPLYKVLKKLEDTAQKAFRRA